jgi:predicted glycoside hydrolase/deacetylase ChbG (UPF0249 family)
VIYIDSVSSVAQLLGLAPDSRLLIIHADDLGMCHSVNRATFIALAEGAISSASVMVPCPAFSEAAQHAARHPEYDIGIHSTLVSEYPDFKWGPVSKMDHGLAMVDERGYFWPNNNLLQASPQQIYEEISAQVMRAQELGINVTHLDSHTFSVARREYIPAYVRVARRFRLPFLITEHWYSYCSSEDASAEDIKMDDVFQAPRNLSPSSLEDFYLSRLREVKPGLSQLIVHPAFDDHEMRAIYQGREAYGAAWRQRDFEIMRGQKFKLALQENQIHVVHWGMIKSALRDKVSVPVRNAGP